jgi:uncharacterized membrane protein YhfC
MIFLSIAIIFALLVTIGLPVLAGIWLNKRLNVSWRVITLGSLGYFIVQALLTLLYSGVASLAGIESTTLTEGPNFVTQVTLSIIMAALLGVLLRWAGMKWVKMPLVNLEAAYGLGLGYGGIESITRVGLPLLLTFFTMLRNINPQASALDPETITQLEALWQVSAWVPIVGSLERISALVMHITITILVLQSFTRKNNLWLAVAVGLEVVINYLVFGLAEIGLAYEWVILIAILVMGGNLYLLYRLNAFNVSKITSHSNDPA